MFKLSFISSGTTASQTPIMASISYEMVKRQLKDHKEKPPDFPIACIFDFSNMYSTLHYYASDKILMRMKELTSLLEILRSSSIELDWSRCSIPSKFAHKDTKEPLFLIIPLFTRGITSFISKTETLELSKAIWEISQLIEKAGSSYIFFDLPGIDIMERDNSVIPALLNSNIVIGVVDCNKSTYAELTREIEIIQSLLSGLELVANPPLSLGGIILNQVTERALIGNWAEKVAEEYFLNIYGTIGEDPQFNKIIIKKEIPTTETHIRKLRCAKDLKSTAESINKALRETSLIRNVTEKQQHYLKERIFSL